MCLIFFTKKKSNFLKKKIENQICIFQFSTKTEKKRWHPPKKPNMYAELI